MNLKDFRTNYSLGKLARKELALNPFTQFERWLEDMIATGMKDPTAMILATVDENSQPNQRYVLLKQVTDNGFVFFTDTNSTKGKEIADNPLVSLLFPWHVYERQVRVQGIAELLDEDEVKAYFHSRPLGSQLAAATSQQSQVVESRKVLEASYQKNVEEFTEQVPLPERWGGYYIVPSSFEFWQGGEHRLHDRFQYIRKKNNWLIQRLQP